MSKNIFDEPFAKILSEWPVKNFYLFVIIAASVAIGLIFNFF